MKKAKLFSRIAAMTLVAIMACCMAASAYGAYNSSTSTLYGDSHRYSACSILYVDGGNIFRGGAWMETQNGASVPPGTMGLTATLINAATGDVFVLKSIENASKRSFLDVATNSYATAASVAGLGWASVEGSPYIRLHETNASAYLRSSEMKSQISALAENTLTEDRTYPVNIAGETCGSVLLADMVGEDPDLISAVNQEGVRGYIRAADFPMPGQEIPVAAVQSLPLYDMNGAVIGSFEIGE